LSVHVKSHRTAVYYFNAGALSQAVGKDDQDVTEQRGGRHEYSFCPSISSGLRQTLRQLEVVIVEQLGHIDAKHRGVATVENGRKLYVQLTEEIFVQKRQDIGGDVPPYLFDFPPGD